MKNINILLMPLAFLVIMFLVFSSNKPLITNNNFESSEQSSTIAADNKTYCTAIRGNGELIPAHWAALARIIEDKKKIPIGGAGGSSASITLFVLDSLLRSPLIYKNKEVGDFGLDREGLLKRQNSIDHKKLAFLLKMIPEQMNYATEFQKEGYSQLFVLQKIMAERSKEDEGDDAALHKEDSEVTERDRIRLIKLVRQILRVKKEANFMMDPYYLGYKDELVDLLTSLKTLKGLINFKKNTGETIKEVKYLIANFKEAMKFFSSFDAEKDTNLFFRPGLIDFKSLGYVINDLLSFYVHSGLDNYRESNLENGLSSDLRSIKSEIKRDWGQTMHKFVNNCHSLADNETWMNKKHENYENCKSYFDNLLAHFYAKKLWRKSKNNMFESKVGSQFAAIPTTSVIASEEGLGLTRLVQEAYNNSSEDKEQLIDDYVLDFERDVFLGYWYNQDYKTLESNVKNNYKEDLKSQKFMNLGNTNWSTVLSTSPAEPGLTNVREFESNVNGKTNSLISAGGWSDLHPVLVLKQLEDSSENKICDEVIYITRRNGESNFNQKVVLRMTGLKNELKINKYDSCNFEANLVSKLNEVTASDSSQIFHWTSLLNENESGCIGVSDQALNSLWGKMSYWWNTKHLSSIKRSADAADDVYCTNWDNFKVFKGEQPQVTEDAYYKSIWRSKSKKDFPSRVGCW